MLAPGSNGMRRTRLRTGSGIGSHRKKPIPEFRSEEEERKFWSENDSTEFIDWRIAERQNLPQLKPTLRTRTNNRFTQNHELRTTNYELRTTSY